MADGVGRLRGCEGNVMPRRVDFNPPGSPPARQWAAVDLGSNTFHLLLLHLGPGEPQRIERLKLRVGLAAGVDAQGRLDPGTLAVACDALRRMADRLGAMPRSQVRAVGTAALRSLRDPKPLLEAAASILGVPLRIISGDEEARLVFAGATATLPESPGQRLVVDIGGGSTEFALGSGCEPRRVLSLPLGCVPLRRIVLDAPSPQQGMAAALGHARAMCQTPELQAFCGLVDEVVGCSGTVESLRDVLCARGLDGEAMTLPELQALYAELAARPVLPVALPGLDPAREDVFPAGVAIMLAIWERLSARHLRYTEGALQDGLMRDLLAGASPTPPFSPGIRPGSPPPGGQSR